MGSPQMDSLEFGKMDSRDILSPVALQGYL